MQRIESVKGDLPYLRYVAVLDQRTRPEHMAWHGTVLPVDHPFWQSHYPPNGWYCRCTVQQLAEGDLKRFGYKVSDGPPAGSGRARPWVNKRTGERVLVPVGIDPGFTHNAGTVSPVQQARRRLDEKIAAAAAPIAAVAKKRELNDWIVDGRLERERLVKEAGGVEAPEFPTRFRAGLARRLRERRGAGTVAATVDVGQGGGRTAKRVREAAMALPASWVRQGNTLPLRAVRSSRRGRYRAAWGGRPAEISVAADPGNPLHEYCHHLQPAMPALHRLFVDLHRRRTAGDPRVRVGPKAHELGREDQYIKQCQWRAPSARAYRAGSSSHRSRPRRTPPAAQPGIRGSTCAAPLGSGSTPA